MEEDSKKPSLQGRWSAWEVKDLKPGCLKAYVVNCPGAHAFWSYWAILLCHLRDEPGLPPAQKEPGAEHEIIFAALNPEIGFPDPDKPFPANSILTPLDLVYQFGGADDELAKRLLDWAIIQIVDGMSPDSDFSHFWGRVLARKLRELGEEN